MKVALITDQHFGVRNDNALFHDYYERFYNEFFFPTLEQHKIEHIVELGDIFDRRKYINFDSLHRSHNYFFRPINDRGITLHCIVGNHDIYFKNTNRVNAPNLLLRWMNEDLLHIYDKPETIDLGNLKVLMMPWINNENYDQAMQAIKESPADVCMGHLELKGFEMYKGAVIDAGIAHSTFKKFDMVMSGHFHHKSSRDNVHYLGSPYEMTWSDYDDDRGFHIFDTKTCELEYFKNPFTMFNKVFYDDSDAIDPKTDFAHLENTYVKVVVKNKENPYTFDLFAEKLNQVNPAHVQIVEDNLHLDMEDADDIINEAEDTATIVSKYIDKLNLPNPKPVHDLFYDLYSEAISNE